MPRGFQRSDVSRINEPRLSLRMGAPSLWLRSGALCALVWLAGCQSLPTTSVARLGSELELTFIGQQVLPQGFHYGNTTVGGLSGLDYDAATNLYWAISDDRSEYGPSRFYSLALDLTQFNKTPHPGHAGVLFQSTQTLKRPDRSTFSDVTKDPANAADPESIRLHAPSGRLVWSSEGDRIIVGGKPALLVNPHVWEMERDGRFVRAFAIPEKFHASAGNRGVRRNLAFEGLAFSPDFSTLYVATESALLQDGPVATLTNSSPTRILEYDYASGVLRAEYVVDVSPIPVAPTKVDGPADNGISEILAIDRDRLLVMERSYAFGVGNTIKLFEVDLRGATNVAGYESLAGRVWVLASKRLVIDLATLKIRLDNLEGMTWGPRLPDGNRSLILMSDDNFNPRQITLFLAFEVRER
ncbi:MAG: esterase-like activity of phytase family protein [Casimicrobiaceae bacterium]